MTGWVLSHRRRFVTDLIWSSGCTRKGHHSRYHRFFSKASWCLDALCCVLAKLLVVLFAPSGLIVLVRDALGKRPDQMFYCTYLAWKARKILSTYAGRWSRVIVIFSFPIDLGIAKSENHRLPTCSPRCGG